MKRLPVMMLSFILLLGLLSACGTADNAAQSMNNDTSTYPEKPIKLIVSYSAGGGTDTGARLLTPYLEEELGQSVVVENKPGAAGWLGWGELAHAEPDGYTLGYVNAPAIFAGYVNPSANRKENLESFEFITSHVKDAGVIAVKADDERFKDINSLIEYARKNEVSVTSNGGVGSENHMAALQMNKELKTKFRSVQYDGASEAITGVMGGHVEVLMAKVGEVIQPAKNGDLRVLAVTVPERVEQLPDVPTLKETTGSDITFYSLRGIAAPKGTDPEIIGKLQAAFDKAMNNEEHVAKMKEMGLIIDGMQGEEFLNVLKEEEAKMIQLKGVIGW